MGLSADFGYGTFPPHTLTDSLVVVGFFSPLFMPQNPASFFWGGVQITQITRRCGLTFPNTTRNSLVYLVLQLDQVLEQHNNLRFTKFHMFPVSYAVVRFIHAYLHVKLSPKNKTKQNPHITIVIGNN